MPTYIPAADRYDKQGPAWFRRCGRSGLLLPAISLGTWHNYGQPLDGRTEADWQEHCNRMLFTALDLGITHFDCANFYGPPRGAAEARLGKALQHLPREELVISTKAGSVWGPPPYLRGGTRKHMIASLDGSLQRLGLDYVDIYYHHIHDPHTPLDETLSALDQIVRSGKAVYIGVSNYSGQMTSELMRIGDLHQLTRPIVHQPSYNLLNRTIETDLLPTAQRHGLGVICFCPLAQGLLTGKYLQGIPTDSRAASATGSLKPQAITSRKLAVIQQLSTLAQARGQSLAQMALAWVLRHPAITSALIGASRPEQIIENVNALQQASFTPAELDAIDAFTK